MRVNEENNIVYALVHRDYDLYIEDLTNYAEQIEYTPFCEHALKFDTRLGAMIFRAHIKSVFGEKIASRLIIERIVL